MNSAQTILKEKSKSFYFAGRLLPRDVFADAARLYAFCRQIDDAIDEEQNPEAVHEAIRLLDQGQSAIQPLIHHYQIPQPVVRAFLESEYQDQAPVTFTSRNQLLRFAYGVAGTVGVMMSHVLGRSDAHTLYHAIDLGIAMQLTNIARDVREDALQHRHYLPPGEDAVSLVHLAERYFQSGIGGIALLPYVVRPAILTAAYSYRAIGQRIVADPDYAATCRVVVPRWQKTTLASRAVAQTLLGRLRAPVAHDASLHAPLHGLPCVHMMSS